MSIYVESHRDSLLRECLATHTGAQRWQHLKLFDLRALSRENQHLRALELSNLSTLNDKSCCSVSCHKNATDLRF